jgi:putative membrane protein
MIEPGHDPLLDPDGAENLPARDRLAALRSLLANERTLLAFARTSLSCFTVGLAALKLSDETFHHVLAYIAVAFGVYSLVRGVVVYGRGRRQITADLIQATGQAAPEGS